MKKIIFIRKDCFELTEHFAGGDVSRKIVNDPNLFLYDFFIDLGVYPKKLMNTLIRYSYPINITYDKSSALLRIDQNTKLIMSSHSLDYKCFVELGIIDD